MYSLFSCNETVHSINKKNHPKVVKKVIYSLRIKDSFKT